MSELVTLIANVSLALSFVAALIFGVAQVRAAARDRRERFALEALRNFQTREFAELMHHIVSHHMPKTIAELRAQSENEQIIFTQLSQQMESLGLLVSGGFISLELVDRTLGTYVTIAWSKYKPLFEAIRVNDPYSGEYFQWLAEHLDENMHKNPREPFYKSSKKHPRH